MLVGIDGTVLVMLLAAAVVRQGAVAVDEFDVRAAAAVGALHDDLGVVAQRAVVVVVVVVVGGVFVVMVVPVRKAGAGPVGVGPRGGGGDGVEGTDVGDFGEFGDVFGVGGEGAEEVVGGKGG